MIADVLLTLFAAMSCCAFALCYAELRVRRADRVHELAEIAQWRVRAEAAEVREREATERLVRATKDGYTVPDRVDDDELEASAPLLTAAHEEWLNQWEDPLTRAKWEQFFVRKARTGRSVDASLADADLALLRGQHTLLETEAAF